MSKLDLKKIIMIAFLFWATFLYSQTISEGITGRVIDESGNGIANVSVQAYTFISTSYVGGASTDAEGNYSMGGLTPGSYKVYFQSPGNLNYVHQWYNNKNSSEIADPVTITAGQITNGINAQLAEGGSVSGRVTDEFGNGILSISIGIYSNYNSYWNSTDAEGYYTVRGIPAGNCTVFFYPAYAGNYIKEWYNDKNSQETADILNIIPGQTIENIDAQLAVGGIVSGHVIDEAGNGIENIDIYVYNSNYSEIAFTSTDSQGNYSLGGIPTGNYKIFFRGYQQNYVPEWYNDKAAFDTADQVSVTVGQATTGINVQLAQGGIISGRVTNAQGNGIYNVSANVHNQNNEILFQHCHTDSQGYYTIYGIPVGTYKVDFSCYGINYLPEWYNDKSSFETADTVIVTVGQTTPNINAQLTEGGIISGAVTDTQGTPLENIRIEARISANVITSMTYTDSSGQYSFKGLPAGTYKIYFYNNGQDYFNEWYNNKTTFETADPLNVTAGQTIPNIDAQLAQGGRISGTVTDNSGNPIDLVGISIYDLNNQSFATTNTNSSGYYISGPLPMGNYKIYFIPPYGSIYLSDWYNNKATFADADAIPVTEGQTTARVDAQLLTGGSVTGTVTDLSGNPIQNVSVNLYLTSGSYKPTTTNANGEYEIKGLATGNYKIYFNGASTGYYSEWYADKTSYDTADPVSVTIGQTTAAINAQLILGGTLNGQVSNENGIGIQNVRIRLYDVNGRQVAFGSTNPSGNYSLMGILPGNYRVYFDTTNVSGNYVFEYYNDKFVLSGADTINITPGQTTTINATLSTGGIISGKVTDTGGNGIANVQVSVRDAYSNRQYKYKYTDSSGNYSAQGIPGGTLCKVYFNTASNDGSYISEWYNDKADSTSAQIFTITPGQTFPGINAVLAPGGIISGRITDASTGAGIPDMEVYAYDSNGNLISAYGYSDENGDYTIKGLATGNFKINFETYYYNQYYNKNYIRQWYNDKSLLITADSVAVTAGQTTSGINAVLTAGGGTISGRVTDENGVGIANITVYVEKDWTDVDFWSGQTDANGNYQVTEITPGTYHVYFLASTTPVSYAPQMYNGKVLKNGAEEEGDWVQITGGETTSNIDAILSAAGTVTGRVTDSSGNGIQNIRVRLYEAGGDSLAFLNASTDYYGYYTIYRVPPGQLKAYFSSIEGSGGRYRGVFYNNKQTLSGADTFTVQAGVTSTDINAVMTVGGGTISGYVRLKSGQAIAGAVVRLYDVTGPYSIFSQISTNTNGYFEFKGLLPGTYKLNTSCKSIYAGEWYNEKATYAAANVITITEGGAAQVEITLGETTALQVTSPNGGEIWDVGSLHAITWTNAGPVGNVKIEYSIDNGLNWIEIVSAVENTGNYNWTVPAAPSANCKVRISGPGGIPSDVSDAVFTIFSNPAGWVPLIGMQNNMAVYGKAYHGINEAAAGDWLGAFGPGGISDCRGVSVIDANGNYYITIRSDASSSETITFKLWPNPYGPTIDAGETIEFISDNIYAALPLHFGPRPQNIPLMNGWNWIAFNTLPADISLNSVFAAVQGSIEQVKSQTQAAIYSGGNWIGDLADMSGIANGIMYKVKTTQTCTLSANGLTISFNNPLPLVLGWNWTAYLPILAQPMETAMNSIMTQLNQVKSQTQSAVKVGNGLIGDLTQMEPNKGYTIKLSAPGVLVYPQGESAYPDQSAAIATQSDISGTTALPWKTIQGNQYNMVSYGKVFFEGLAITTPGYYLVSVGPNGERDCRSVSPIGTDGSYFSTVLGNTNGETIKFKLYNSNNHKTYEVIESQTFQSDTLRTDYNFRARSLKITAPGEGTNYNMGSVCNITWEAYEVSNIKIELYKNGKSLLVIANSVSVSTHAYNWTIPARMHSGNNYQIRISAADTGVMAEDMTGNFNILPTAVLTLNYPVGMETWQIKRSYDITWGSGGIDNIKIELYKGVALNTVISQSTPAAAGKYTWTVPANQTLGSDYKIKISSIDAGVNLSDTSKSAFTIAAYKNTTADFDGDGKSDLAWRYYGTGGYNCLWLSGITQGNQAVSDARLAPQAVTIQDETNLNNKIKGTGDFNNDGKEDLLWRDNITGNNSVWTMNGTVYAGTVPLPAEATLSWDICGTGDFNSDGKPDILWRNAANGSNKVWLMDGVSRTSEVSLAEEANLNWTIGGVGDFNSDGKVDILWHNTSDNSNRVWIMDGTALTRTEILSRVNVDWEVVGVGDYDGNGKADIFWRNKVNGKNTVWIMDGLARAGALTLDQVTDTNWKIEN